MFSGGEQGKYPQNFVDPSETKFFVLQLTQLKFVPHIPCPPVVITKIYELSYNVYSCHHVVPKFCNFFLTQSFANFFTLEHFRRAYFSTFSIFSPTYPHFRGSKIGRASCR